jgi:hypothetical protein
VVTNNMRHAGRHVAGDHFRNEAHPEVASRCCKRSWAASSIFLCRHSDAR